MHDELSVVTESVVPFYFKNMSFHNEFSCDFLLLPVVGSTCGEGTKHFNNVESTSFTSEHVITPANMDATTISRYIHIKHSDSPVRIFKETTV